MTARRVLALCLAAALTPTLSALIGALMASAADRADNRKEAQR